MAFHRHGAAIYALVALVGACGGAPAEDEVAGAEAAARAGVPRLVVVSSLDGYIEPCGCTVDLQLGGIDRIATAVAEERERGPTAVLMVGPRFFAGPVATHLVGQNEAVARLLARAFEAIGIDAVTPGEADLARGPTFYSALRRTATAPDVTVNAGGAPRVLTLGNLRVGVFGLATEGATLPNGMATDPAAAAREAAKILRADGARVVVGLASMPRKTLRRVARGTEGVDLWFLGDAPREETLTLPVSKTSARGYIIEAGDRGRHVAVVELGQADGDGPLTDPAGDHARRKKALDLQIQMRSDLFARTGQAVLESALIELKAQRTAIDAVPLQPTGRFLRYSLRPVTKDIAPEPLIAQWRVEYDAKLHEINLAHAVDAPPVPKGGSGYVGLAECVDCHEESHSVWDATPHARAWQTLVDAGKTADADCVSCHVTGWLLPGGASLKKLDGYTDIGCEACHGPGERHVDVGGDEDSTERLVPAAVCVTCHNKLHSPKFDYATYLPKVLGIGHAQRVEH